MKLALPLSLLILAVMPATSAERLRSFTPPKKVDYRQPPRAYFITNVHGWTLHLESELVEAHPRLTTQAVTRLAAKLDGVLDLLRSRRRTEVETNRTTRPPVPMAAYEKVLQRLSVFLMLGEEARLGGRDNGAEYFQRVAPDFWPHIDSRWRSALVIYSARNYGQLSEQWATQVLVHELAHAWHLEQWPEKQPDILAAWQHARDSGLYRKVKAVDGSTIDQAYALANQLEYFAELSCAYFWRGEYHPLDRAALRSYDPVGCAMIEKMWGLDGGEAR